jgi:hypothetical protein
MIRASEDEKAISKMFPNEEDFRYDFELTPVLTAVLREYDISDPERPELDTLLKFMESAGSTRHGEDWNVWRRKFRNRSPLFQELISVFQQSVTDEQAKISRLKHLLNQPDALQRWTPLHWAAFIGHSFYFIRLLQLGADLFAITPSRRNVAHHAAESRSDEILSYLFQHKYHERGVDINLPDIWGETPLHIAAAKSLTCTALLVQHGASVNARQGEGQTPLHYVRYLQWQERLDVVRMLLNCGSDPNAQDEGGRSPMFYCIDTLDSVQLLLDHGANISINDVDGQSMLHYACIHDYC